MSTVTYSREIKEAAHANKIERALYLNNMMPDERERENESHNMWV